MVVPVVFDPRLATLVYRRHLPHLRQRGVAYFITFRLGDAVPREVVTRWQNDDLRWLEAHPEPLTAEQRIERMKLYGRKLLKYLDAGHGSCLLRSPAAREIVRTALHHFERDRYLLGDYAIMPNHVHALVLPLVDEDLTDIAASWTRYTAVRLNRLAGRAGPVWQEEPFDHIVRDRAAYLRFAQYVRDNPSDAPDGHAVAGKGTLCWPPVALDDQSPLAVGRD